MSAEQGRRIRDLMQRVEKLERMVSKLPVREPSGPVIGASATAIKAFLISGVSANTSSNDENTHPTQWLYTVNVMKKESEGYGAWTEDENHLTGYKGYNWLEDANVKIKNGIGFTNQALFQNGVDHHRADYPDTWMMQPLLGGTIHPGIFIDAPTYVDSPDRTREVWLFPYSGEDGDCE